VKFLIHSITNNQPFDSPCRYKFNRYFGVPYKGVQCVEDSVASEDILIVIVSCINPNVKP